MLTLLQQTGYDALKSLTGDARLQFTSFKLASGLDIIPDVTYTDIQGPLVFTGGPSDMRYVPWQENAFILQLIVGPEKPDMQITNVMLFVDDEVPFIFALSNKTFFKLTTISNDIGIRWMMQIEIRIPNLLNYFSFDNLNTNLADFIRIADENALESAFIPLDGRDQGILLQHAALGRAVPLIYSGNELWGNPLFFASDDQDGFCFDGGDDGDLYKYFYDPNEDWLLHGGVWNDDLRWRDSETWED